MTDCTVLLVDDAPDIRFLLRIFLDADADIRVVSEAGNGQEAVEQCAEHKPDVVVLDISMPVMDGLQAIPLIRDVSPRTNIIMLSGFTTADIKAQAMGLGACEFLEKGTPGSQIVSAVKNWAAN